MVLGTAGWWYQLALNWNASLVQVWATLVLAQECLVPDQILVVHLGSPDEYGDDF